MYHSYAAYYIIIYFVVILFPFSFIHTICVIQKFVFYCIFVFKIVYTFQFEFIYILNYNLNFVNYFEKRISYSISLLFLRFTNLHSYIFYILALYFQQKKREKCSLSLSFFFSCEKYERILLLVHHITCSLHPSRLLENFTVRCLPCCFNGLKNQKYNLKFKFKVWHIYIYILTAEVDL